MLDSIFMQCLATMGMAAVPVVELRGAIPFGLAFDLPPALVFLLAVVGNMLPMPFILFYIRRLFRWLRQRPWWGRKIDWLETRGHLKGRLVREYRVLGLVILVAIPLPAQGPGRGPWWPPSCRLPIRRALLSILAGVIIAGGIVMAVSCGVISML